MNGEREHANRTTPAGEVLGDAVPTPSTRAQITTADRDAAANELGIPAGLNLRMARAGQFILDGMSTKRALIKAGFATSTASAPKANNLSAERCILEFSRLSGGNNPRNLLSETRAVGLRQIRAFAALPDASLTKGEAVRVIPRLLETMERYHGEKSSAPPVSLDRTFAERAADVIDVVRELQRRGLAAGNENADSRAIESTGALEMKDARRRPELGVGSGSEGPEH